MKRIKQLKHYIMAILMKVGRPKEEVVPEYGKKFKLEELQKIIDGYIYVISLGHGKGLVVDEDGELKGLTKNEEASKVLQEAFPKYRTVDIVGTAVLVTRKEFTWQGSQDPYLYNTNN